MSRRDDGQTTALLEGMVEAAPDGMLLADDAGTIVMANQRAEVLFGYQRGQLLGRPVELLVPERLRAAHRHHRAAFARHPSARTMGAGLPVLGLRRDGSEFPAEVRLSPVRAPGGALTLAVVQDVLDHVGAELRAAGIGLGLSGRGDPPPAAADLAGRVSERLFAAGMSVQSAFGLAADALLRARLERALAEIDRALLALRAPAFGPTPERPRSSLHARVLEICAEARADLGLASSTRFVGPVEIADVGTAEALLMVLHEALSNVARHGLASSVEVTVTAGDVLVLAVDVDVDVGVDEVGARRATMAGEPAGHPFGALEARAREFGGTLSVGPQGASRTRLEWRSGPH